jgi:signal transduction histidine kinase
MKYVDPKIVFKQDISADLVIRGDHDAVKQIILISLDNAINHTKGNIEVNAKNVNAEVEIHIKDQGEGIPADKLEHVFDRFYRGKKDNTIMPGFGLGLSIAKALVEKMNGSIILESELTKGSTLIIIFIQYTQSL